MAAGPAPQTASPAPPSLPQGLPEEKSCLSPLTQAGRGSKLQGATGGCHAQASLAVPKGRAAGLELALVRELGDVVAVRKHPLVLPCRVDSEPPVSISWQWDGPALANDSGVILMPDGSLHLAALTTHGSLPSHAHEYPWVAQNPYGRPVSRRARIWLASVLQGGLECTGAPAGDARGAPSCPGQCQLSWWTQHS